MSNTIMEENWDKWCEKIRLRILKAKSPLSPEEINSKIKLLENRNIPYEAFQFQTLEEMLKSIPGLKVIKINKNIYMEVVSVDETSEVSGSVEVPKISSVASLQQSMKILKEKLKPFYRELNSTENNECSITVNTDKNDFIVNSNDNNSTANGNKKDLAVNNNENYSTENNNENDLTVNNKNYLKVNQNNEYETNNNFDILKKRSNSINQQNKQLNLKPIRTNNNIKSRRSTIQNDPIYSQFSTQQKTQMISVQQNLTQNNKKSQSTNDIYLSQNSKLLSDDPRLQLHSYTTSNGLILPMYKHLQLKNNNVYSVVTVDTRKYSSYPFETKSKEEAEKIAARRALDELLGKNIWIRFFLLLQKKNYLNCLDFYYFSTKLHMLFESNTLSLLL